MLCTYTSPLDLASILLLKNCKQQERTITLLLQVANISLPVEKKSEGEIGP